jgi:hypothetical protein
MHPIFKIIGLIALIVAMAICPACGDDDDDDDGDDDDTINDDDDDSGDDDDNDDNDDDTGSDDDDDDDDNDDTTPACDFALHDPLIEAGKEHLGLNRIYEGYEAFDEARTLCPDSVDARMGLALSCQLELERSAYEAIRWYLANFGKSSGSKSVGSILQSLLENHFRPKALEFLDHAQAVRAAPTDWSFYIEAYPFVIPEDISEEVIVDLGGEWDKADGLLMEAEAEAYLGIGYFLCAHDLTTDGDWGFSIPDFTGTPIENIHETAEWLLLIFNDPGYPQFLTLTSGGAADVAEAGSAWGAMYLHLNEAFTAMLEETDDQADDLFGYVDENANNAYDEGEPLRLPYFGQLDPPEDQALKGFVEVAIPLAYTTWDTGPFDVHPARPDYIWFSQFNFLLEAYGLPRILPPIPFRFGPLYYNAGATTLKDALRSIMTLLYDWTTP